MRYNGGEESLTSFLQIGELACKKNGSLLSSVIFDPTNQVIVMRYNNLAQGNGTGEVC